MPAASILLAALSTTQKIPDVSILAVFLAGVDSDCFCGGNIILVTDAAYSSRST